MGLIIKPFVRFVFGATNEISRNKNELYFAKYVTNEIFRFISRLKPSFCIFFMSCQWYKGI